MVRLKPMTEVQFERYLATAVPGYAQAHIAAGDCSPEDALALAQVDYRELLPDGLKSANQFLFTICDDALGDDEVGIIWIAVKEARSARSAYIYDIDIREDLRGKGYGRLAMAEVEKQVREMGIFKISLNVFGYNHGARALYEKIGYQITGIGMTKTLAEQ